MRLRKKIDRQSHLIPRSKLDERRAEGFCLSDNSKPLSMLSIAVTFCLLACNTLSRLRSVPLPRDFACESKRPEDRDVPDDKLEVLSIATIAEVPYPGTCEAADA
jgi:hypothetical protein